MIEKIQIENFQRHALLRIRCGPVTSIVGPSDSGKSAVIRALRWLCLNPRGAADARHGESMIRVRVKVDGRTIRRERTPSKNLYAVDGSEHKAVGADVPEQVADLLNLGEENFQGQLDGPFWLDLTPGELARRLNSIVDLGSIDESLSRIASELRRAKSRAEVAEERRAEAERRLAELEHVPRMVEEFERLRGLEREAAARASEASSLASLAERAGNQARKAADAAGEASGAEAAVRAGELWREAGGRVAGLRLLLDRLRAVEEDAGAKIPDVGELDRLRERAERERGRASDLRVLWASVRDRWEEARRAALEVEEAERELEELTGGVCPVCGGPMK